METDIIMQTLKEKFDVGRAEVSVFKEVFNQHPYTNLDMGCVYRNKVTEDLDFNGLIDKVFALASVLSDEVQDYFFDCYIKDAEDQNKGRLGEPDFYIVKKKIEERRKAIALSKSKVEPENEQNREFTTARQVLAIYYLLSEVGLDWNTVNKTDIARFSQFLTCKEIGNSKIENTNLYKRWKQLYSKSERKNRQDLEYVKSHFERMGLHNLATKIQNDMDNG